MGSELRNQQNNTKNTGCNQEKWGLVTSRCLSADDEKDAVEVVGGQRALCCPY